MPGDITGDGVPDLLVGAPGAREGSGRVYLFSGADILAERVLAAADAWAVYEGSAGTAFGSSLTVLGDVDGDGWTDWALGAPTWPGGDAPPGRLWIMPGGATVGDEPPADLTGTALAEIDGPNPAALLGRGVAGIGDMDGDGRADLAVITRDAASASGAGQVRIIAGLAAGNWPASTAFAAHAGAGYTLEGLGDPSLGFSLDGLLAAAGDLDGDGLGDLWVGQPGHTGAATRSGILLLLPGRLGFSVSPASSEALAAFIPDPSHFGSVDPVDAHFGQPLRVLESDDGPVLWVGADGPERGTAVGLRVGPAPFVSEAGVVAVIAAPPGVSGGLGVQRADLLGTGEPALLVGVPRDGAEPGVQGAGRLAVFEGTAATLEVTDAYAAFLGDTGQLVGAAVEILNLDMDAYDDALVGAPGAWSTGAVLVLLGGELADGDGFAPSEGDCDDAKASVHPGATEISACADSLDNDCNGLVDGADAPCILEDSGVVVACSNGGSRAPTLFSALLLGLLIARRRRWWGLALATAAVGLAGCPSVEPDATAPTIAITSPADGDRLEAAATLTVVVEVSAARLAPELQGQTPTADLPDPLTPVLWSLFVDDLLRGTGGGPILVAEGLGPGSHTLRAELVDTLGEPLVPAVSTEVSVQLIAGEATVVMTQPTEGEVLSPSGFLVEYDVAGFLLNSASIGQPNQLGVGHALIKLDGSLVATDADGQAFVSSPSTGSHELSVVLVNNDGSDLDPVVADVIDITVAEPAVVITSPVGTSGGGDVPVEYEVSNFTLDPTNINGTPVDGRGHAHVYVDGLYRGLDATGSFTVPDVDGCTHVARVELAAAGHEELGISDESAFSVLPCVAVEGLVGDQVVSALGGAVNITYSSPGHLVETTNPPQFGGSYVTHYLDGAYVGYSFTTGNATFFEVPAGVHTFGLRLAAGPVMLGQEQDGELDPRASTSITLDVQ